jgi:hypothetical protein
VSYFTLRTIIVLMETMKDFYKALTERLRATLASSGSKASYRSASARATAPAARGTVKSKNPAAPAVKREAEKDWGKEKWR